MGSWSTFALRAGKPEQIVRVLPSTAGISTWVISPQGCPDNQGITSGNGDCEESRGGIFRSSNSSSWHDLGDYTLEIDANLGHGDIGASYGLDTINLGFSESNGGPKLESQVVASLASGTYYLGLFGLNPQATNISFSHPYASALTTMKRKNLIPSLSWAYTAGAQYRESSLKQFIILVHDYESRSF